MAGRRRSRDVEPEPAANGPADVGFTKDATAPSSRTVPGTSTTASGRQQHTATVVPDPNIRHGAFRVLQRTDGPFVVIDERLPPGAGVVAMVKIKRGGPEKAARLTALAEAERQCIAHAYPNGVP